MKQTVIVYGPKGCGKTRNAERLRAHFGLDLVIDDWSGGAVPLYGALVLTSAAAAVAHFEERVRWCAFDLAMLAFRDAADNERRERIATAVLAGFASLPIPGAMSPEDAVIFDTRRAVEYADALIAELDK